MRLLACAVLLLALSASVLVASRPHVHDVTVTRTVTVRTPDVRRLTERVRALEDQEWQDHLAEQARIEWLCSRLATSEGCRTVRRDTPEGRALLRRHGVK